MKRTPRVVIPPPTQKCRKSTVCRREQLVRRCRAPTLRKPFFCRNKPRAGLFRHSHSSRRVVIPPPHRNAEKMQNGSFYHRPQQGSRRNPAKRFRWEEDERQRERVLPLAAGRGIRRPLGRRPASHLSGLRRSRTLPNALGGAWPHTPFSGRSPTHSKLRAFLRKALPPAAQLQRGPVPFEESQLSEGAKEIIPER